MSLRRSARVQASPTLPKEAPNGNGTTTAAKKRGRPAKATTSSAVKAEIQEANGTETVSDAAKMPPPPQTPNKRRRVAKVETTPSAPPPLTPTPSAIGLMTSNSAVRPNWSSGDIDDATPPPAGDQPVRPHHTNATLVTPGGTQVPPASYSNFEEPSPSKPPSAATTATTNTLLSQACAHLLAVDPTLSKLLSTHHCHAFSPAGLAEKIDPFRSLASGIIAQQVSGAAAKSIKNKFIALFPADEENCPMGFPRPAIVAKTPLARLREAGLSQRKAEYIQGLAEKFASGELNVEMLMSGSDEQVMEALVAVRGLGKWSVEMFMCFGLKRMDVFSTGDLGVQRGMAAYAGRDVAKLKSKGGGKWKYMAEKEMLERSEPFRPYRSLFMWYMWRIEDVDVGAMQDN